LTTFRNKPTTSSWVSLSTTTSKPSLHVDLKRLLNKFFYRHTPLLLDISVTIL
jgi:hypothetical protein